MTADNLNYEDRDGVAVITMDDGKANALSHQMIGSINDALSRAEREARSVLLTGRAGRFSAGFDLNTMRAGPESIKALVIAGAELCIRLYMFPRPVVAAATGHALAAGAILLLASDSRIGARGDFKIGLNEVSIGMVLPVFGVELARARLSKRHFSSAVSRARIYDPDSAVDAGFLDRVATADALFDNALVDAQQLAGLAHPAFFETKKRERQATVQFIRDTLEADINAISGAS